MKHNLLLHMMQGLLFALLLYFLPPWWCSREAKPIFDGDRERQQLFA